MEYKASRIILESMDEVAIAQDALLLYHRSQKDNEISKVKLATSQEQLPLPLSIEKSVRIIAALGAVARGEEDFSFRSVTRSEARLWQAIVDGASLLSESDQAALQKVADYSELSVELSELERLANKPEPALV
jgi:hypothetical protein